MGYSNRFIEEIRERREEDQGKTGFLLRISNGTVIPVISSSFRIEQIFNSATGILPAEGESTYEQLIEAWAVNESYPMPDRQNLARVYQYVMVQQNNQDDPQLARTIYFDFLKQLLIRFGSRDPNLESEVSRLKKQMHNTRFSQIASDMDYPRYSNDLDDPLRLLAKLPLPYYITTSQSDFLERALELEGKEPVTQVCFGLGAPANVSPAHQAKPGFEPSKMKPLVYHLFGLEDYPRTLVLSEDDYIDFLIAIMGDTDTANPKIPLQLRSAITSSQLVLLGYRLTDWDFRVLLRILLNYRTIKDVPRGMLIQLEKGEKGIKDLKLHLNQHFERNIFNNEMNSAEAFLKQLRPELTELMRNQKGFNDLKNYLNNYFDKNLFEVDASNAETFVEQLRPELIQLEEKHEKEIEYLNTYFGNKRFSIEWNSAEVFVRQLWKEWKEWNTNREA